MQTTEQPVAVAPAEETKPSFTRYCSDKRGCPTR